MKRSAISAFFLCAALSFSSSSSGELLSFSANRINTMLAKQDYPLTTQQKYMAFIATQAASGNMTGLNRALHQGLDNGLTISDCREILTQLYAYAGFPRSLNALTELMEVVNTRKVQGIQDVEGSLPGPMPKPDEMLAAGTQNQTALVGKPVKGPLFDFAPAAGEYLKTHLFGDIFSRDNLNWKSRELATVGALSAMEGVDPQLQAHLNMSMNTGIMYAQLAELVPFFEAQGEQVSANRLRVALNSVRTD